MTQATNTELAAVGLAVTQGLGVWLAVCPKIDTIYRGDIDNDDLRIRVRHGEMIAGGITLVTGAIGTVLLKSPFPFVASAVLIASLVLAYELTLRLQVVNVDGSTDEDMESIPNVA